MFSDFAGMSFEQGVDGVQEANNRAGIVAFERLGAPRHKVRGVLRAKSGALTWVGVVVVTALTTTSAAECARCRTRHVELGGGCVVLWGQAGFQPRARQRFG